MGSFFFSCPKSRTQKLDAQESAILQCKITRDNIKAYIKRLEKNEKQRKDKAKSELKQNNRDKAKIFLNQSKFYREQINIANGQLTLIEEQVSRIEMAQHQKEAMKVLEAGNKVLKQLTEEVNVEKWEKIADDMRDIKSQQDEIGDFLKNHNIDQEQFDEELNKELESLIKSQNLENKVDENVFPYASDKVPEKSAKELVEA